ncbi:MAG: 2-amino-4-hydroxy-6-hydroxymethyldihydropteridine diphosphokinase [Ardenticatenales bacterium]|nr:2-amino-4-hydroxy-6-hydroxymethyldihydropteridine diphosphokinase [Ardenticatenales bacterium]
MPDIYLALGSNQGDREMNLATARARLSHQGWVEFVDCSPVFETEPWGPVSQGWYLNQVCHARTSYEPRAIMRWINTIERQGGRERTTEEAWGPRPIDIDLLAYGDKSYKDHMVEVPHPLLHARRFVLEPLASLAPDWRHPALGLTVAEMLQKVDDHSTVRQYNG